MELPRPVKPIKTETGHSRLDQDLPRGTSESFQDPGTRSRQTGHSEPKNPHSVELGSHSKTTATVPVHFTTSEALRFTGSDPWKNFDMGSPLRSKVDESEDSSFWKGDMKSPGPPMARQRGG